MLRFKHFLVSSLSLLSMLCATAQASPEEKTGVTAIDIVIKPDNQLYERALKANADLLKNYPEGFALDGTHNPHITLFQTYVKTDDLKKVFDAATEIVHKEKPKVWKLEAFKYYYGKMGNTGLAGIVVRTTPDLLRLQKELIDAVSPYSVSTTSASAFVTTAQEPEVDQFTRDFVAAYAKRTAGDNFNPHVTTGIGTVAFLDRLLAEPFQQFTSSPAGICVYQLGAYGTARKLLKTLD